MNQIELLQKQIDDLKFMLNLFVKPNKYIFQRDLTIMTGKSLFTDTGSKVGLFGATPIVQPTAGGLTDHAIVGGGNIQASDTFSDGNGGTYYTISDIVAALKILGILTK